MRCSAALSLAVCLIIASAARAGKLSAARSEVRSEPANHDRDDDDRQERRPAGKLAEAGREVRAERFHRDRDNTGHHGDRHHHPRRRSRGGPAIGVIHFDYCDSYCPPPVVERYVYPAEPVYVAPTYAEPIQPTLAQTLEQRFAPYPYSEPGGQFMVWEQPGFGKTWSGRVQFELGSDFDGLSRNGATFLVEGAMGFGLSFDWDTYTEELADGGHDELHIGELDLLYRLVESDHALVRVGLGTVWLGDRYDTDFGVNFTLQADVAPCEPIILSGELDLGTLGDAEHLHAAATVGVMLGRCELFGGYDFRRIGDVEIQGPLIGLRVWF